MSKLSVPAKVDTPVSHLRETLDDIGRLLGDLRGAGSDAVELLHLFDQSVDVLAALEQTSADVRAERVLFDSLLQQFTGKQARFLAVAGSVLGRERAVRRPDPSRWWWFIDETVARERREQRLGVLRWVVIGILVLAASGVVYRIFLAPSPQVTEAYDRAARGERLVTEGDLAAAAAEYEVATELDPEYTGYWMWLGVLRTQLGETDAAEAAFNVARAHLDTEVDFLVRRGERFLGLGDLEAATDDVEEAIAQDPKSARAFFVRADIAVARGDCPAALADLDRAAELARASGEAEFEAFVRVRQATLVRSCQMIVPSPVPDE